jgi:beta-lactamase class D
MKLKRNILYFHLILTATTLSQEWEERSDWQHFFTDAGVNGTIAVVDERTGKYFVYNNDRSLTRFIPASTFKIPHTLFALDAGIVEDEFQIFQWDGIQRQFASWNKDQNLRSAMTSSTVWLYQIFARELGERGEREYLGKIGYGNEDISGGIDRFWLTGGLRISAREQINFLQALYQHKLPFDHSHQRLVKDIIIIQAERDWILRGKTGWGFDFEPQIGWFVGWIETPEGPVFFALNIDMPDGSNDTPKREAIVRNVLKSLGTLPD